MLVFVQRPLSGVWLSDCSRLTTIAVHINVKGERTARSCLWDASAEVGPSMLQHKSVFNGMEEQEVYLKSCLAVRRLCEQGCHGDF